MSCAVFFAVKDAMKVHFPSLVLSDTLVKGGKSRCGTSDLVLVQPTRSGHCYSAELWDNHQDADLVECDESEVVNNEAQIR